MISCSTSHLYQERRTWCSGECSGESCLTESPDCGFEAASPDLWGKEGLPRFIASLDLTHVGASTIESVLFFFLFG